MRDFSDFIAWLAVVAASVGLLTIMAMLSGCALLDDVPDLDWPETQTETPEPEHPRPPAPTDDLPYQGEFIPDPNLVLYTFTFADGTTLTFRENHDDDFWGNYPNLGWGLIRWPDGTEKAIDVNRIIRHGVYIAGRNLTPVTTPDHGKRMYWFAYPDNRKRVEIFEDGWNPLVEGAVLGAKESLGIRSHLVTADVTVESYK